MNLDCIEIEPNEPAEASVIWLHGLGASGQDFVPMIPLLKQSLAVRYIFPNAPAMPITANQGYPMPAWYDILAMTEERQINQQHLMSSSQEIAKLIDREIERGIDSQRIVLAGFSQGGAVAYHTALTYPHPLAGLLAMSTYFASKDLIDYHPANQTLPIYIYHGSRDFVVRENQGLAAQAALQQKGYNVGFHRYPIEHTISPQELRDIATHLALCLSNPEKYEME